uniref:Uncharacterized protein n=1 Tax=Oryza punctata TaxID=4537 RepID=A0A0E0JGU2_ORYPU
MAAAGEQSSTLLYTSISSWCNAMVVVVQWRMRRRRNAWSFGEMESNEKQKQHQQQLQVGKGIKRKRGRPRRKVKGHAWIIKEKKAACTHGALGFGSIVGVVEVAEREMDGWMDARYSRQANKSATENVDLSGGECGVEWSRMVDWLAVGVHPFLWMRPSSLPAWTPTPGRTGAAWWLAEDALTAEVTSSINPGRL